jgi:hypothetical protein
VFLVRNSRSTLCAILNIFNMPKILIQLQDCVLWFNGFSLTTLVPQSDSRAESYGPPKLVGS